MLDWWKIPEDKSFRICGRVTRGWKNSELLAGAVYEVSNDREKGRGRFPFVDVNINTLHARWNRAGVNNDGNIGLDSFHLSCDFNAGGAPQHVIGDGATDRRFAKGLQSFISTRHAYNGIAFPFQDRLAQMKVNLIVFNAKQQWTHNWLGIDPTALR